MVRGQGEGQPQRHRERQPQTSRFLSGIPVCPHRHLASHIAFVSGPTWDFLQEVCGCIQGSISGIKESPTTSKAGLKIFRGPVYTLQKSPLPTPRGVPLEWGPKPQLEASITKPCVSFLVFTRGICPEASQSGIQKGATVFLKSVVSQNRP